MTKVPAIVAITDLRQDAAAVVARVRAAGEPVVITQRGRAAAILLSVEQYEHGEMERDMLRALVRGDKEIARGRGHSLDDVLRDADQLLLG